MELLNIEIDDKYTLILDDTGSFKAFRNGEEWRDLCGDKLILCMAFEIQQLREIMKNPY